MMSPNVVVFLASPLASYITGHNLVVDGGSYLPNAQADAILRQFGLSQSGMSWRTRASARSGSVSELTLGGGGLGQVWGETSREEAVATVRAAVDAGITLLDMAPMYGRGEAERVVGEAFGGRLPDGVRVGTKVMVGDPGAGEVWDRVERSVDSFAGDDGL